MEQLSPEPQDRPEPIRSAVELAGSLGCVADPEDRSAGVRSYLKSLGVHEIPLTESQVGEAFSTLTFSDQGRAAGRKIEERISIGVNIPVARSWESTLDIRRFAEEYPQLVVTDAEGFKSVAYDKMTAILLQALNEQQQEINLLKEEVNQLKSKN